MLDRPAFADWFGASKLTDALGQPLVVFHASTYGDFDVFKKSEQRKGMAGYGFYFSDSLGASIYTDYGNRFQMDRNWQGNEKKLNVMPVYLSMQNPLVVTDMKAIQNKYQKRDPGFFGQGRSHGGMAEHGLTAIQRDGYDGVISTEHVKRKRDGSYAIVEAGVKGAIAHPVYVVFEATQIKSAIGNSGLYDRNNPDITDRILAANKALDFLRTQKKTAAPHA